MNTPNKLTVVRMIMVPFFVLFMLTDFAGAAGKWISLLLFVAASFTDYLDGHLARKYNLVTDFGKFMDDHHHWKGVYHQRIPSGGSGQWGGNRSQLLGKIQDSFSDDYDYSDDHESGRDF